MNIETRQMAQMKVFGMLKNLETACFEPEQLTIWKPSIQ